MCNPSAMLVHGLHENIFYYQYIMNYAPLFILDDLSKMDKPFKIWHRKNLSRG